MGIWFKLYFLFLLVTLFCYSLAAIKRKNLFNTIILGYCLVVLITSTIALYYMYFAHHKNNLFLFHIFTPVEYSLISWLYAKNFHTPLLRKLTAFSIPLFVALALVFSIYIQPININNSDIIIIESILLCAWALLYLRELIIFEQTEPPFRTPLFWLSVGVMFYFLGNLFVEGLLNYLMRYSMESARRFYDFGFIFKYVFFLMLIFAVRCWKFGKRDNGKQ
jgi:hypothetical protein